MQGLKEHPAEEQVEGYQEGEQAAGLSEEHERSHRRQRGLFFGVENIEGFVKIIYVLKIIEGILFGLAEEPVIDHIKDDDPEVLGGLYPPVIEDYPRHGAVLLYAEFTDPLQELFAGHVRIPLHLLLRKPEGLQEELVGVDLVTRVLADDMLYLSAKITVHGVSPTDYRIFRK